MKEEYIHTYLQDERQANDVVLGTGLTAIIKDPSTIGLDTKKLKALNCRIGEFLAEKFRHYIVKLYSGITPLALGEVTGGAMNGKRLVLDYKIVEVFE